MAQALNVNFEAGKLAPEAFLQKSPRGKPWTCFSPSSQVSTAPSTPCHDMLPDVAVPEMSLTSDHRMCRFVSNGSIPEEDEEEDLTPCLPEPQLHSQLGKWAQRHVEETPYCFGMPRLESELGQWAQRLVDAQYWYSGQKQNPECETSYLVDSSSFHGVTRGLAYRRSKQVGDRCLEIEGPMWGTTVTGADEGDGWLKVGDFYLPTELEGIPVVTPAFATFEQEDFSVVEAVMDGPALTEDGRVVDLDGGAAMFFASDPKLSYGFSRKQVMMKATKDVKKARASLEMLLAGREVDNEAICSLDAEGVLRGEESYSWSSAFATKEAANAAKERSKLFQQKRRLRQQGEGSGFENDAPVLGIDPSGYVFIHLDLTSSKEKHQKKLRRRVLANAKVTSDTILILDASGVIHDDAAN
jgi:hypothetical protein